MKAGSTAMTQRPRDRVPSGSMLALPDPRRPDRANPSTNFWWSLFFDSTGMIYMHWVSTEQTVNKECYVEVLREFNKRFCRKRLALFKSGQWHFHKDNAPVHNSILFDQDGHQDSSSASLIVQTLLPVFCLFPKLKEKFRGCCYETIEEMKEAVTKVIDTVTQEDFHGALQNLLERYNKCIAAGGDYFEEKKSFMCILSIKVSIRRKSGNLFNEPCISI